MTCEDIPQGVVEAAAADIMPWTEWSASKKLGLARSIVTRALAEYERLGYRLVRNDKATVERLAQVAIGWSAFAEGPVLLGEQGARTVLAALTAAPGDAAA